MNMLPPMKENAYQDHAQAVHDAAERRAKAAAERTAKESMSRAADEVKELNKPDKEGPYNSAVSGDGTWKKRGFSSSFGVLTVLSSITGKVLDCEIMPNEYDECKLKRGKGGTVSLMSGENINTNAKQTLQVLLALLILQVCWQYFRDQLHSTIPKWNFSDIGSVKPITFLSRKMSMVM